MKSFAVYSVIKKELLADLLPLARNWQIRLVQKIIELRSIQS